MALAGICRTNQVLRIFKFSRCSVNFLTEAKHKNVQYQFPVENNFCKYFCTDKKPGTPGKPGDPKTVEAAKKKKKGLTSPQITLITPEEEVIAMTLEQADKMAKRRNLKLVQIVDFDTKTERPVYKLMTALDFFEEGSKLRERKKKEKGSAVKETKLFTMSTKIDDHDLQSKIRHMFKLLKKKNGVKVFIAHDGNPPRADEIEKIIEDELKEVFSKKERTTKTGTLKLLFKPKIETEATEKENESKNNNEVEDVAESKNEASAKSMKK